MIVNVCGLMQGLFNHLLFSYNKHIFIYDNDNSLVSNTIKYGFIKRQRLYFKH